MVGTGFKLTITAFSILVSINSTFCEVFPFILLHMDLDA